MNEKKHTNLASRERRLAESLNEWRIRTEKLENQITYLEKSKEEAFKQIDKLEMENKQFLTIIEDTRKNIINHEDEIAELEKELRITNRMLLIAERRWEKIYDEIRRVHNIIDSDETLSKLTVKQVLKTLLELMQELEKEGSK